MRLAPRSRFCLFVSLGLVAVSCREPSSDREARAPGRAAGTAQSAPDTVRLRDASGREHVLTRAPRRVLSLVPSATRILDELGARNLLVGRTDWDTAQALSDLPSVGGGLRPSMERVVALEPDLVIRFEGPSDRETPKRLDDLGIPHFSIRPDGIGDVEEIIRELGTIVGRRERADSMVAAMEGELDDVRRRVRGLPRPSVAFLLGGSPPMAAGPGTFIQELLEIAGGVNAFSDLDRKYAPVSPEELVARKIEVILYPRGSTPPRVHLSPEKLHAVSPLVETPGPRLADAARELARVLHPEAFR